LVRLERPPRQAIFSALPRTRASDIEGDDPMTSAIPMLPIREEIVTDTKVAPRLLASSPEPRHGMRPAAISSGGSGSPLSS
jgi:hypothetical protein